MEQRTLEINVSSAKDLKNVNLFSKMDVYAVVSIAGDPHNPQVTKTTIDREGDTNPTWNFPIKFNIYEGPLQQNRLNLVVQLLCERALGDKVIGVVNLPMKELFDGYVGDGKSMQFVSYQVKRPSGKAKGELTFSYKFGDKVVAFGTETAVQKSMQPITGYPASVVGPSSAPYGDYPAAPPQQMTGYTYPTPYYGGYPPPPPPGYGYPPPPPPPPPGYGYPPVVQQPGKKKKFGLGLGAGLLGGVLGGLLIGDLVSDSVAYDCGYDSGFADAGGF